MSPVWMTGTVDLTVKFMLSPVREDFRPGSVMNCFKLRSTRFPWKNMLFSVSFKCCMIEVTDNYEHNAFLLGISTWGTRRFGWNIPILILLPIPRKHGGCGFGKSSVSHHLPDDYFIR
jgi:hypothetical protein